MSDTLITALIAPAILMILGGIGFGFKWLMSRSDKKLDLELQARNQAREDILNRLSAMETKLEESQQRNVRLTRLILGCEHPECPTKAKLLNEL